MTRSIDPRQALSHALAASAAAGLLAFSTPALAHEPTPVQEPVYMAEASPMAQDPGRRGRQDRSGQDRQEQRVDMNTIVRNVSRGREGRRVGVREQGSTVVVTWEYPGGRVVDIIVDARTGRIVGER